ncbi:circularly permuted type 2 ATP-grasp protein [Botrimarina sp.]|uniref:circularly permuted type 2 ATP-grasp protein n=1 Tax=Botrimarina sp. TaxID=2795802 RepID=UPI0032EDE310
MYQTQGFDEMFTRDGEPQAPCRAFVDRLQEFTIDELKNRQIAAELHLNNMGITFNVYGHEAGVEKVWPFDVLPRIIGDDDWRLVEAGLKQRVTALNLFIDDIYNDQRIIADGVVPMHLIQSASSYRPELRGFSPTNNAWCHISGVDLVRNRDGTIYVLEDNLRCPSGVSYVLENREIMKRTFATVFQGMSVAPVDQYPERLLQTLLDCAPPSAERPQAVVLTPGVYNSAYFEHTFLAQQMGVELVQGVDLVVSSDDVVYMRTTQGMQRVDVIYRRIDDDFLDPECFRPDSMLGVPGLLRAWRAGKVTLANAPGTGVADDKAVYAYVPEIIRYYLSEEPLLENVPTYTCWEEKQREYVLSHLHELVIKPTNESGGYGIVLGPRASEADLEAVAERIRAKPREYIAQPMLELSTAPTLTDGDLEPRHIDLRPFVLAGKDIYVMPGGLTRVALVKGSMIVNSSQGGGSKDTWVLRESNGHGAANGHTQPATAQPSTA